MTAGRSTSRINGRAVPASVVQQVAQRLVDVHSQASHLSLVRPKEHLGLLDRYARVGEQHGRMREAARAVSAVRREIQRLEELDRSAQRELVLLRHDRRSVDRAVRLGLVGVDSTSAYGVTAISRK